MDVKHCIAIIPARDNDPVIPRRNILSFCGNPVISYSIKAALESGLFEEVMVSTNSVEIARVAKEYGATVPFYRTPSLDALTETTDDVMLDVLKQYRDKGREFDIICCIYPIAPFITRQKLVSTFNIFTRANADAILPVKEFSYPPQRCLIKSSRGYVRYKWPRYKNVNSTKIEKLYHSAGQYLFVKTDAFERERTSVPKHTIPFIINAMEYQDLRSTYDWIIAEYKYSLLKDMALRQVKQSDSEIIFKWRNDPSTRMNSLSKETITWEEHSRWFQKMLSSDEVRIYVLMVSAVPVGHVRLNYEDGNALVSYTVGTEYRGRGYGSILLKMAENKVVEDKGNISLIAEVLEHNEASRRCFLSLGYEEKACSDMYMYKKVATFREIY